MCFTQSAKFHQMDGFSKLANRKQVVPSDCKSLLEWGLDMMKNIYYFTFYFRFLYLNSPIPFDSSPRRMCGKVQRDSKKRRLQGYLNRLQGYFSRLQGYLSILFLPARNNQFVRIPFKFRIIIRLLTDPV